MKEIKVMKEERVRSEAGKDGQGKWQWESVRSKILDKKGSLIGLEKIKKLYI